MRFSSLRIFDFRNLVNAEIKTDAQDIFLVGENGQGKSNFLEAVYFCSYASSFRGAQNKELICINKTECTVEAVIKDSVNNTVQISVAQDKKSVVIDGKQAKDRKFLLSIAPSIIFCHEDIQFINGAPEQRRWFFDQNLCLYDEFYLDDIRRYKKLLKTRNTILKELKENIHHNYNLLDTIDYQFVQSGFHIIDRRKEEIKNFAQILTPLYETVSGGISDISVEYHPSWKYENQKDIIENLYKKREQEITLGVSLSGPHRDNYMFTKEKNDFSKKASTGQRRLLALLIRVAQARRYHQMRQKKTILLLDDVLLELDGEKRVRFISVLPDYEQAFYTFLPEEPFNKYIKHDTLIYHISSGHFTEKSVVKHSIL